MGLVFYNLSKNNQEYRARKHHLYRVVNELTYIEVPFYAKLYFSARVFRFSKQSSSPPCDLDVHVEIRTDQSHGTSKVWMYLSSYLSSI